ncbi:MAG: class I SAM-dependent methyltransferase [Bacteroidota bacterium]
MKERSYHWMQRAYLLLKWMKDAKSIDTIDSPYLVDWVKHVILRSGTPDPKSAEIETLRRQLLKIDILTNENPPRTIAQVARHAVSSRRKCMFLNRLIMWKDPDSILELGTCLGISTYYLAKNTSARLTTIERNQQFHDIAKTKAPSWLSGINFILGDFLEVLPDLITASDRFDVIYIDGAHNSMIQRELWPHYLQLLAPGGMLVIDDIHWSKAMAEWWGEIRTDSRFNLSIDLFQLGILLSDAPTKEKIELKMLPLPLRWQLGLWR